MKMDTKKENNSEFGIRNAEFRVWRRAITDRPYNCTAKWVWEQEAEPLLPSSPCGESTSLKERG